MIMYLLDKQQNIIRALDKTIIEANMIEEINTANKLTFSVMTNSRINNDIYYICIPATRGGAFLMFRLISEAIQTDRIEYTAVESAYDELKAYAYIKDARPIKKTASEMLVQILQGTRWTLGYVANTEQKNTNFYYLTLLEAIQKVVELFNVELTFDVKIDKRTNRISSRRINLYTQQGERTGKRFEYESNLLEVIREQSNENIITALVGRGKGEETQSQDDNHSGYGRRITFADIEWKKTKGNPTDKPLGQEYVEDKSATALYGFSDGKPRIGLTTFDDITDPQELLEATWASLQIAKRPKISFKANVLDVGDLGLGDTVAIIRHDLGIEYFTRVYKVNHDLLDSNNNTIELGDDFSEKSLTNYIADVSKVTEIAKNTADIAISSANGKNKNYYSKIKPQYANEGDNLFLDLGNSETEYYVWHNGNWELILTTADTTKVKRQIEKIQKNIQAAVADTERISNTQTQIEKNLISRISNVSEQALNNNENVRNLVQDINQTKKDYQSQQVTLEKTRKDLTANTDKVNQLKIDLNGINTTIANANGEINQIKVTTTGLNQSIQNINGSISTIKSTANSLTLQLNSKVNNTDYQSFKEQTARELRTKLIASDLNGYARSADVKLSIDGLTANFNTLKTGLDNRINTVSSKAELNSQKFSTVYTKNEVDGKFGWNTLIGYKDLNSLRTPGKWFYQGSSMSNSPAGRSWQYIEIDGSSTDRVTQTVWKDNDVTAYTRLGLSGNRWSEWVKKDYNAIQNIVVNSSFLQTATGFAQQVKEVAKPLVASGGVNLVPFSGRPEDNHAWETSEVGKFRYWKNNKENVYLIKNSSQTSEVSAGSPRFPVEKFTTYTVSFWASMTYNVKDYDLYFLGRKYGETGAYTKSYKLISNQTLSSYKMTYCEVTFSVEDVDEGFLRFDNNASKNQYNGTFYFTNVKMEKGTIATPWTPAASDFITTLQLNQVIDTARSHTRTITDYLTGSNSKFSVLSNNLNLKVSKGDVIGQINIEAGKTLLQNKKIYLDADTVGFSGKAFIPSAAIQNLDAGKITTGTLNAANVNVINLNANNITSGSIRGTNLDINLNSGNVAFQKGRIHDSNNYVDINIDEGYISTANSLGRLLFKENSLQIAGYNIFDNTNDYYLKIDNGLSGGSWAGANVTGRDYIAISNKANSDGFMNINPIIQTNFAGISAGKSSFGWEPTFVGGADRGVYIAGGKKFSSSSSYQLDEMPSILIGTNQDGTAWWGNRVIINGNYVHLPETYNKTTSAAPNVYIANDGALVRSTSAAKYKTDIVRSYALDYGNRILDVPIATWIDKAEAERYAKKESEQEPVRHFGMIADDLANAGLEMLVTRSNDGELEGIQYDRIAPTLIPVISNLKTRLELLERKLLNE